MCSLLSLLLRERSIAPLSERNPDETNRYRRPFRDGFFVVWRLCFWRAAAEPQPVAESHAHARGGPECADGDHREGGRLCLYPALGQLSRQHQQGRGGL